MTADNMLTKTIMITHAEWGRAALDGTSGSAVAGVRMGIPLGYLPPSQARHLCSASLETLRDSVPFVHVVTPGGWMRAYARDDLIAWSIRRGATWCPDCRERFTRPPAARCPFCESQEWRRMRDERRARRTISVKALDDARENFAGVGTRKAKLKLNRLATLDPVARALRLALQAEDESASAKRYHGKWRQKHYDRKQKVLMELVECCREQGWTFGVQPTRVFPSHVVYFDIPECQQISFHLSLPADHGLPMYGASWDGQENSTLAKLSDAVRRLFLACLTPRDQRVGRSPLPVA
jgi:hypothetical protein